MTTSLRRSATFIVVAVLAPIVLVASPALAATKKPTKVDVARANAQQIRAELQNVTKRLEAQQAKSASARQAAAAAAQRLRSARAEEAAVTARLEKVRSSVRELAVREYIHARPGGARLTIGQDPGTMARSAYLRSLAVGETSDVQDSLRAAREDTQLARERAEVAAQTASDRKRAVSETLSQLQKSRDRQLELAAAAESRVLAALKESEAAKRLTPRASRSVSRRGAVTLTTVRGITVATQIAGQLERMLAAADADGRRFGGSGYRSSEGQVAARRRNCGSSDYDVYEKPASRCSPPTARPGQSMHEQGLAIDFTYNGSLIQSRSSDGFQWLKANAARFGFYNLPSEPWHWSVNGN